MNATKRHRICESHPDLWDQLPKRDNFVVRAYYEEELTMREIGELLGISESRISQILNRAGLELSILAGEGGVYARDGKTVLPVNAYWHGSVPGYNRYNCRCDGCRLAWNDAVFQQRERRKAVPFDEIPHGVNGYDNYSCRCRECKDAWSANARERTLRRKMGLSRPSGAPRK